MKSKTKGNRVNKQNYIGEILDECRKMRNLPEELRHRTFVEFGFFIKDMVDFFVWNVYSDDNLVRKFQKKIEKNKGKYNPEKFGTYVELFHQFWKFVRKEVLGVK